MKRGEPIADVEEAIDLLTKGQMGYPHEFTPETLNYSNTCVICGEQKQEHRNMKLEEENSMN